MIFTGIVKKVTVDRNTHIAYAQVKVREEKGSQTYQVQFALRKGENGMASVGHEVMFVPRKDGTGYLVTR